MSLKISPMADLAIVIPAYKTEYLDDALQSFQNQTDRRFHIYVGDDCSPHDIHSVVKRYESSLPITYRRFAENLGQVSLIRHWARCIDMTAGEKWIWLFSDDDEAEKRCVEGFYRTRQAYPEAGLFHFDLNILQSQNGGAVEIQPEYPQVLSAGNYLESKLRGKLVSYVVEFIFSRNLYERVGGFHEFDLAWGSDFITWLKMASGSPEGIVTVKGPGCKVNWRSSSLNISPDKSYPIVMRKLRAWIENAVVIKSELKNAPQKYAPLKYSFRWIRFPIGEIWRHRHFISVPDMALLFIEYLKKVIFT